jgi:hypothetical protein
MWVPDTNRPIFDPHLDIATVVFSHVQDVQTRHNLALVSKLWRDASKEVGPDTLCAKDRCLLSSCEVQAQHSVSVNKIVPLPYVNAIKVELERKSQGDTLVKVLAFKLFLKSVAERELDAKTKAAKGGDGGGGGQGGEARGQGEAAPGRVLRGERVRALPLRRHSRTLGLPAESGGQQVPGVGVLRREIRGAPQMK